MIERDENLKRQLEECSSALRSSEARFRNVVTRSADGMIVIDGSGTIIFANPAAESLFGRKADELIGELFGFPMVASETSELTIVSRKDSRAIIEMRIVETEWEEERALLAKLRDITERKQSEENIRRLNAELSARSFELEAANQELEAFNYTVAHDLRKPLTVINGYCQVLTEACGDMLDENCKGYLREAYDGTWRMNRLIDDLLNFSGAGHAEPERQGVNLSSLACQVASELKQAEPERRVTFRISDDISAETDPALLRIILTNLFGNAWKYTGIREEGIIEFDMAEFDGRRAYFVRDNGIGFDPSGAGKLFEPFQRLESAKVAGGLGIGFSHCSSRYQAPWRRGVGRGRTGGRRNLLFHSAVTC